MSQGLANANIAVSGAQKVVSIFPGDYAAADEGSFFTSWLTPTASTAVATTTQALAQTNPSLAIFNGSAVGSQFSYNIYLRYVKLLMTAVTTGATTAQHVGTLDNLSAKLTTIGTLMGTPQNTNPNYINIAAGVALYGGVNIAAASTAAGRIVHTGVVTNSIPIILDTWTLAYGEPASNSNLIGTMTLVKNIVIPLPPVVIPPGWWYTLGFWGASWAAAAPTYGIDVGFIYRPSGQ
jgi:hypothetical protein